MARSGSTVGCGAWKLTQGLPWSSSHWSCLVANKGVHVVKVDF